MNDLIVLIIVAAYIFLSCFIPFYLYKKNKISKINARNSVHFFAGLSIISIMFAQNKWIYLIISALAAVALFFSRKSTPILRHLYYYLSEEKETIYLQGPMFYAISITYLILSSIILNNNIIPIISALIMIISDPLAAYFGKKYGKNKIILLSNERSLEGSIALMASTALIISLFYGFSIKAVAISFILAIIELISPGKIDDLSLPLFACLLLSHY